MSYCRGEVYVWEDGKRIHIWAAGGVDGWDESGWADSYGHTGSPGVALPMKRFDELVVMRYAELTDQRKVRKTAVRALKRHRGNGGCEALEKFMGCKE